MNIKLWKHQEEMRDWIIQSLKKHGFAYLHAGMRTGKTLTMYSLIEKLPVKRVLILTPKAAAKSAWLQDYQHYSASLPIHIVVGASAAKREQALSQVKLDGGIYVINYEAAWRTPKIKFGQFDLVIADESHKLKSHSTRASNVLAELCMNIPYKVAMTGTGWDNTPLDLYGQFRWFKPEYPRGNGYFQSKIFGSWTQFFNTYALFHSINNIQIVDGYKNIDQLSSVVAPYIMRVKTEDVLKNMPAELKITRYVEMSPAARKAYKELREDSITTVLTPQGVETIVVGNPLERALRLQQITSGFYPSEGDAKPIVEPADNEKLQTLLEIVEEADGEPLVVFTRFRAEVALIKSALEEQGIEVKQLTGDVQEHVEWQAGAGQVLIVNLSAGSTGVTLSRANIGIYYSLTNSAIEHEQSRYRMQGQKEGVDNITLYYLLVDNSIDFVIYRAIQNKLDVRDEVVNHLKGLMRVL